MEEHEDTISRNIQLKASVLQGYARKLAEAAEAKDWEKVVEASNDILKTANYNTSIKAAIASFISSEIPTSSSTPSLFRKWRKGKA